MPQGPIEIEQREGVVLLRLARQDQRNALIPEMRMAFAEAVDNYLSDANAGCLLITGSGDFFCAGGNLKGFSPGQRPVYNRDRIRAVQTWAGKLINSEKPVVTAVNGCAAGAGFGLAMLGDIILATESAFFLPGFSLAGMVPDLGLAQTLTRAIGAPRASDILLTNRRIDAPEAASMGMISRMVPDSQLQEEAFSIARRLANGPRLAFGLTKGLIRAGAEVDTQYFFHLESSYQALAMGSEDHEEGVRAFIEKRKPNFKGA